MADRSESPNSINNSEGEVPGGSSEVPPAQMSKSQQPALALQEAQLDAIVQRVVAKLQVPGPPSTTGQARAGSKGPQARVRPLSTSSDSEDSRGGCQAKRAKKRKN